MGPFNKSIRHLTAKLHYTINNLDINYLLKLANNAFSLHTQFRVVKFIIKSQVNFSFYINKSNLIRITQNFTNTKRSRTQTMIPITWTVFLFPAFSFVFRTNENDSKNNVLEIKTTRNSD